MYKIEFEICRFRALCTSFGDFHKTKSLFLVQFNKSKNSWYIKIFKIFNLLIVLTSQLLYCKLKNHNHSFEWL